MYYRPGSLIAALAHSFALIRKAINPEIVEAVIIWHKPSHNYSSISVERWEALPNKADFELAARVYKHDGPNIRNMLWDILDR